MSVSEYRNGKTQEKSMGQEETEDAHGREELTGKQVMVVSARKTMRCGRETYWWSWWEGKDQIPPRSLKPDSSPVVSLFFFVKIGNPAFLLHTIVSIFLKWGKHVKWNHLASMGRATISHLFQSILEGGKEKEHFLPAGLQIKLSLWSCEVHFQKYHVVTLKTT